MESPHDEGTPIMQQRIARPPLKRIQIIDHRIRVGEFPNAETLAAELEVNARTIQRDIEFMRDQLRAPLDFCRMKNGYRYTHSTFQLPFFQFSEGELVAFFLAERLLQQFRGTPYETDLSRAFSRIVDLLPDEVSINLQSLDDSLSVKRDEERQHHLVILRDHVFENRKDGVPLQELLELVPSLTRDQVKRLLKQLRADGILTARGGSKNARWFPADSFGSENSP